MKVSSGVVVASALWVGRGGSIITKSSQSLSEKDESVKSSGTAVFRANIEKENQNLIRQEIKRRLNSGNACCHSVQNLLSSRLLSKNIKVRIYKTIILPVVLHGCET
jgi:hypothetical protein